MKITDAMVDIVGAGLYIHWHDVNEQARNAYRAKIRKVLETALASVT